MIQRHLAAIILFSGILRANAFNYKDAGNWGAKYKQCIGRHQSPIVLKPGEEGYPSIDQKLKFTNFNKLPTNVTIKNTGHTVEVKADWSGKRPTVTGGPLKGNYVFEKTTFHWDAREWIVGDDEDDEETDYDNPTYPLDMEMHMFFYKTDLKSFEKAQKKKGGLAVFNIGLRTDFDKPEHFFDDMEKNVHKVQSSKKAETLHPFRLLSILGDPHQQASFTFYEGSLDHPPCFESVTWFINDSQYAITKKLVNEFRKVKLAEGDKSNVRPFQEQFSDDCHPKTVGSYIGKDE